MTPGLWLQVALAVLVASNLAAVAYAVYLGRRADERGATDSTRERTAPTDSPERRPGTDSSGAVVDCAECGEPNDREYRYCGNCAAQLPGVWLSGTERVSPERRGVE